MATPNGPFDEGYLAFTEGEPIWDNPYYEGSEEYHQWVDGFYDAEDNWP